MNVNLMSYKIDLHIHSNHSDSSFDPKEIIDEAAKKNMIAVAIADHDTFTATPELQAYARSKSIHLFQVLKSAVWMKQLVVKYIF